MSDKNISRGLSMLDNNREPVKQPQNRVMEKMAIIRVSETNEYLGDLISNPLSFFNNENEMKK